MALSDRWTRATLRTVVRRELLDPSGRWFSDAELNGYLDAWQSRLQDELEFCWGTATVTTSLSTLTLTDVATDILRPEAIYWNNRRLVSRTKEELDILDRNWRQYNASTPYVAYQDDLATVSFWPEPSVAGTVVFEYPKTLALATDTSPMSVPAWTRYSAAPYCTFRAYLRFGPNQDANRSGRAKAKFYRQLAKYKSWRAAFFPDKYLSLRPGGAYEKDILQPEPPHLGAVVAGVVQKVKYKDEVPSGTVNGVNATFTLTEAPNPAASLNLYVDGVRVVQGTHYTINTTTITFVSAYIPVAGQTLFATYRYLES